MLFKLSQTNMKKFSPVLFLFLFLKGITQPNNINISNTNFFGGEPYLAINPTNPKNIIIAWMAIDLTTAFKVTIRTKTSFDGGQTWGNIHNKPHLYSTWGSADPSIQFRNNGTAYLCYIDYRENPDSGKVLITKSLDGGITWSAPTQAWDANTEDPSKVPLDRPWLKADNSNALSQGMFYMTTKPAPWIPAPNRAYLKWSSDSGTTWSTYKYVDTTSYLIGNAIQQPMTAIAVAANGALCLAYPSYVPAQSVFPKYFFAKSMNKGGTFTLNDLLVNPSPVSNQNYKLGYTLAAHPTNANQLAFCFISNQNGDPDVYITTSNNGGTTWSTPVRANDDITGNGKGQDLAWISYSTNNKLLAVWRDKRNGTGTGYYEPSDVYCAVSADNGATFQPNIKLSNVSANHDTILTGNGNDFLSCELLNDTVYAAWGDVRTGKLNIFFTKTSINTGTGIEPKLINSDSEALLGVFPGPASDKIQLQFHDKCPESLWLFVYNQAGKKVLEKSIVKTEKQYIDVSALPVGIYLLRAENKGKTVHLEKIIITR
jgi:hypothetical protein